MTAETVEPLEDEIVRRALRQQERDRRHLSVVPDDVLVHVGDTTDPWEHDQRRYRLGIRNIDNAMQERRAADFLVVGALPGVGKTSVLEQSSVANAREGHKVLVVSLEMTIPDLDKKMIGREMGVTMREFERQRALNTDAYLKAKETLRELPFKLYRPKEGQGVTIQRIFAIAEKWGADMIALDYAAMIEGWQPGNPAREIINYCASRTKDTGIYLMLLTQLQVMAMHRKNFRPTIADFADTKSFAAAATGIVFIHRPFIGEPRKDIVAEWIIAKNRRLGPCFRGHSHWHGPTTTFGSMTEEEEAKAPCCYKAPKKKDEPAPPPPTVADEPEDHYAQEELF